ncbi:translation initiation factor eIF2B subunit alpha-like [Lineus longissimus]|uniref:translation initiation factor eIF2B subunit alpha-like n=1 Tax=Lineus longissimus TaxID=88925 RepID=UPI00315CDF25
MICNENLLKMDSNDIVPYYNHLMQEDPSTSQAVAAIKTLIEFIRVNPAETLLGLRENLNLAIKILQQTDGPVASIASGCDLFVRFITLTSLDHPDFQDCKSVLVERGKVFLNKVSRSRRKIAKIGIPFIRDGTTILTHSKSRVVLELFKEAAAANKRFNVYLTESMPDKSGVDMFDEVTALGIPATLILDAAVGYIMENVDLVLIGAEGVVESGGIINKIGTYTMALSAKELGKPVYVVAESFKFTREFPLNQRDIPANFKYHSSTIKGNIDLTKEHPLVDYTPPSYITLLFTDLGVLTPSAVSDELIKLYL